MKTKISITVLMLSAWMVYSSCDPPHVADTDTTKDVRTFIENANEKIEAFYKEGLIDSLAMFFADSCIQMPPNSPPTVGIDTFRKNWQEAFGLGQWIFSLETQAVKSSGNLAVELGTYSLDFTPNASAQLPSFSDRGSYVVLWENFDGQWKIVWDAPVSEIALSIPEEDF